MAFLLTGVVVYYAGENPLDVFTSLIHRAIWHRGRNGLHPLLYHQLHLYWFSGGYGFSLRPIQYWWRGANLCCRIGGFAGLFVAKRFQLVGGFSRCCSDRRHFRGTFGAFIPGWLQAKRGSHVVITTIMFNYLATALINYLLVDVLIAPNQQSPQSRAIASHLELPLMQNILGFFGFQTGYSPLNISFFLALFCCFIFWLLIWKMKFGYELRVMNQGEKVAKYAGIPPAGIIISAMVISGMFAGLMAINSIMGEHHRLIIEFTNGPVL